MNCTIMVRVGTTVNAARVVPVVDCWVERREPDAGAYATCAQQMGREHVM